MKTYFKNSILSRAALALFALTGIFLQSCLNDKDDSQPVVPTAYVSFYQSTPDAPGLDIFVDNKKITTRAFEYNNFTGYLNFYTGSRSIKFTPVNASNALIDTSFTFQQNKAYSLFIVNTLSNIEILQIKDSLSDPATGKAGIRIINLSPDAGAIDASVGSESNNLFTAVNFKQVSNFTDLASGKYTFNIKKSGETTNALSLPDITLAGGHIYTIIVRGFKTPPTGNTNTLSGQVIVNY